MGMNICVVTVLLFCLMVGAIEQPSSEEPETTMSSSCRDNLECEPFENTVCENEKCVCQQGFIDDGGFCKPRIVHRLDENIPCTSASDCHVWGGYVDCVNNICACINGSVSYNKSCYLKKVLGEHCDYNIQCNHTEHAVCFPDICSCVVGYVIDPSSKTCLTVVDQYEARCEESIQCEEGHLGSYSLCADNKCICHEGYFYNKDKKQCHKKREHDEQCNENNFIGCYLEADGEKQNIICLNNTCVCKANTVFDQSLERCISGGSSTSSLTVLLGISLITFILVRRSE